MCSHAYPECSQCPHTLFINIKMGQAQLSFGSFLFIEDQGKADIHTNSIPWDLMKGGKWLEFT